MLLFFQYLVVPGKEIGKRCQSIDENLSQTNCVKVADCSYSIVKDSSPQNNIQNNSLEACGWPMKAYLDKAQWPLQYGLYGIHL